MFAALILPKGSSIMSSSDQSSSSSSNHPLLQFIDYLEDNQLRAWRKVELDMQEVMFHRWARKLPFYPQYRSIVILIIAVLLVNTFLILFGISWYLILALFVFSITVPMLFSILSSKEVNGRIAQCMDAYRALTPGKQGMNLYIPWSVENKKTVLYLRSFDYEGKEDFLRRGEDVELFMRYAGPRYHDARIQQALKKFLKKKRVIFGIASKQDVIWSMVAEYAKRSGDAEFSIKERMSYLEDYEFMDTEELEAQINEVMDNSLEFFWGPMDKYYVEDSKWEENVTLCIDGCDKICVFVNHVSEGLRREIELVMDRRNDKDVLFIVGPDSKFSERDFVEGKSFHIIDAKDFLADENRKDTKKLLNSWLD